MLLNDDLTTTPRPVDQLRAVAPDAIVAPGDHVWDTARRAWNLAVDQRPVAVAFPKDAEELAAIVRAARGAGLRIAPQATGHGAGALGPLDGAVLLRTDYLDTIEIDAEARRARVGAGVLSGDLVRACEVAGLAAPAGSAADVGIVGYALGGGIGWLARARGLACNSITAVELVTADGHPIRADQETAPELFWALRGGGGSYGIVTAIELELQPVGELQAGSLMWPIARAAEVLSAWTDWAHTAPETVTSLGRLLRVPDREEIPAPVRGGAFVAVEAAILGSREEADRLLAPLRALGPQLDGVRTMTPAELPAVHMDPEHPVPSSSDGALLDGLPSAAIDALLACAGPDADSPLISVELRHLGGAVARRPVDAGALASIAAPFALFAVGPAPTPELTAQVARHLESLRRALGPWHAPVGYLNFSERAGGVRGAFSELTYAKLSAVKSAYDPDDAILAAHPVDPAT